MNRVFFSGVPATEANRFSKFKRVIGENLWFMVIFWSILYSLEFSQFLKKTVQENFQICTEIDFLPFVMPISPSKHVWIRKMIPLLKDKNFLGSVMQETSVFTILSLLSGENQVWKSWTFGLWQSTGSGPNDMEPKMPGPFSMKSKPCSIRFEKKNHWCEQLQTILTTKV